MSLTFDCELAEVIFLDAKIRKVFSCIGILLVRKNGEKPDVHCYE